MTLNKQDMGNKRGGSTENLKRDDSYIAMSRRRRRKNMMLIIPIVAALVAIGVVVAYAFSAQAPMRQLVIHIHPHLNVTVDGNPVTVPSQVGIDQSLWKDHSLDQYGGMLGMAPLHTHDASGIIHVESSAYRNYTLGQFLDIWGGLDTNGKTVKATVDGNPVSDYKNIILKDGEQISLGITK
jgi:hypothetical protein